MTIQTLARTTGKKLADNSPLILTGLASAGVVTTAIMAAIGGQKAADLIFQDDATAYGNELTPKEKIDLTWKCYVPAAVMGTATVACVIGAHSVGMRRNAALAAAYGLVEKSLHEYEDKLKTVVGDKVLDAVNLSRGEDELEAQPFDESQALFTGQGDALFRDSFSGRDFYSSQEHVKQAVNAVNAKVINNMYASMNDFYDQVGLPRITMGEELGFRSDRLMDISLTPIMTESGRPCAVINYLPFPTRGYYREH